MKKLRSYTEILYLLKAIIENIIHPDHQSFTVQEYQLPYFDSPWHFHPEYELTYIESGYGTRFVGDSAEPFQDGDLVLIGKNMPHYWRCHDVFYQKQGLKAHSIVIQFHEALFFTHELPEMQDIHLLLKKSGSGIYFKDSQKYVSQLFSLVQENGFKKLMNLYELLQSLSQEPSQKSLSISRESQLYQAKDSQIFQKVIQYIFENIREEISLSQICEEIYMSTPAFCRYFKKRTKMTFTEYVNKLRVIRASQLLIETDWNISQICYECGFNSLSYFNRQFKKFKHKSPKAYRIDYRLS